MALIKIGIEYEIKKSDIGLFRSFIRALRFCRLLYRTFANQWEKEGAGKPKIFNFSLLKTSLIFLTPLLAVFYLSALFWNPDKTEGFLVALMLLLLFSLFGGILFCLFLLAIYFFYTVLRLARTVFKTIEFATKKQRKNLKDGNPKKSKNKIPVFG